MHGLLVVETKIKIMKLIKLTPDHFKNCIFTTYEEIKLTQELDENNNIKETEIKIEIYLN